MSNLVRQLAILALNCSVAEAPVAAGGLTRPAPACVAVGEAPREMVVTPLATDRLDRLALGISTSLSDRDDLRLVRATEFSGRCISRITSYVMGSLFFDRNELVAQLDGNARLGAIYATPMYSKPAPPRLGGHPGGIAGIFRSAVRISIAKTSTGSTETFIGVWERGGTYTLAKYSSAGAGAFTRPKELLQSRLPIDGLSYFPAPDSMAGRVSFFQKLPRRVRIVEFDFTHLNDRG